MFYNQRSFVPCRGSFQEASERLRTEMTKIDAQNGFRVAVYGQEGPGHPIVEIKCTDVEEFRNLISNWLENVPANFWEEWPGTWPPEKRGALVYTLN